MPVLGWIAHVLGWIMNGIYIVLEKVGIENVALCIIIYTVIVYLLMTPIQMKQQKMMKVQNLLQPEIREITKKYAGRRDTASQQKLNEETMAVYEKYGVSPTGSCLPMILQMLLLFSVYQVIYHIPGYINKVGQIFSGLADKMSSMEGGLAAINNFISTNNIAVQGAKGFVATSRSGVIDFLYMLSPRQWALFQQVPTFSSLTTEMAEVAAKGTKISSFLGMHISESTINTIKNAASDGRVLIVILAILIPVLAILTQFINVKLTPNQNSNPNDQTAASMKMINLIMPVFSGIICFSLSIGVGVYWIAGSIVRIIQQVIVNRSMMHIKTEDIIEANKEKIAAKREREKERNKNATNNINERANVYTSNSNIKRYNNDGREVDYYANAKDADPNSLYAKANRVKMLDEQNKGKKKK